jgi:acetolactate synthase-1/2/3 large subunit
MNGAESLVTTLVDAGVDVCFTNPGTSEMQFVAALDRVEGMRGVLALFEGVVTGAADGYARMAGKPACTLLHLGPGLANGLANLHNARRARTSIVNIVGEHATYHRALDAPLTSDIEGFARPVSGWIRTSESAARVAEDAAEAVAAANAPPGQIATLILPADTAWTESNGAAKPLPSPAPVAADPDAVEASARALASGEPCVMLMNGRVLSARMLELASRIANKTGANMLADTFITHVERGAGRAEIGRLPYFAEQATEALANYRHLVLVATKSPVSFFAYPNTPSRLAPKGCETVTLVSEDGDIEGALEQLAARLDALDTAPTLSKAERPALPSGELTAATVAQALGHLMPEGAIVSDESATSGFALAPSTQGAPPHDWLALTGGAIGQGMPVATGAAVACPDRRVISLEADGSGMYTLQSLWTQAREGLNVTSVIFANRKYAILQIELLRVGAQNPGPKAMDLLDLSRPNLDWVELAKGMGVPASRPATAEEFNDALGRSFAEPGPSLIEVVI